MTEPPRRLGRGLSALLGETAAPAAPAASGGAVRTLRQVPVADIAPGRFQPRQTFPPAELEELAASIRVHGVLQPVLLRKRGDDPAKFELIAGERRWRAAQLAGVHEIPAVIRDLSDREALEAALVENLQRQDLDAIEEAEGYRRLMQEFAYTQDQLAAELGKSRSHLANLLRILELPLNVQKMVRERKLSASHAKALVGANNQVLLAQQVVSDGLSVRETEKLVRAGRVRAPVPRERLRDPNVVALERRLSGELGCAVQVAHTSGGKSALTFRFSTLAQLQEFLGRLGVG